MDDIIASNILAEQMPTTGEPATASPQPAAAEQPVKSDSSGEQAQAAPSQPRAPGIGHNKGPQDEHAVFLDQLLDEKDSDIMDVYHLATKSSQLAGNLTGCRERETLTSIKSIAWVCWCADKGGRRDEIVKRLPFEVKATVNAFNLMPIHFTSQMPGNSEAERQERSRIKTHAEYLMVLFYADEADLRANLRNWTAVDQITKARDAADPAITGKKPRRKSSKPRPMTSSGTRDYTSNIAHTAALTPTTTEPSSTARNQSGNEDKKWRIRRDWLFEQRPVAIIDQFDGNVMLPELGELGVALVTRTKDGKVEVLSFVRGTSTEHNELVQAYIEQLTSISYAALRQPDDFDETEDASDVEG